MINECDFTHVNNIHRVVLFCCLLFRLHIMSCCCSRNKFSQINNRDQVLLYLLCYKKRNALQFYWNAWCAYFWILLCFFPHPHSKKSQVLQSCPTESKQNTVCFCGYWIHAWYSKPSLNISSGWLKPEVPFQGIFFSVIFFKQLVICMYRINVTCGLPC